MKILILGLGQYPKGSGVSAAAWFAGRGDRVRVTDMRPEQDIAANVRRLKKYPHVTFVLGRHRKQDLRWADLIVRNPAVRFHSPWLAFARSLGTPIVSDVSLFMSRCPCPVVGVTGTRGKSTTTALIAEMMNASGTRAWLGGNIKVSPLTFLKTVRKDDVAVLELSSWLVETIGERGMSPKIACITNIMRDHLNAYGSMEEYVEAKAQIFRHQGPEDVLILNADDPWTPQFLSETPSHAKTFSIRKKADAYLSKTGDLIVEGARILNRKDIRLLGEHNVKNALAAALTAASAGATSAGIRRALKSFRGLPDRLETIAVKNGIRYINDTTATTPDATLAAFAAFAGAKGTIHVLFGGADKELEFDELARAIKKMRRPRVCVTVFPGTACEKIEAAFRDAGVPFQPVSSMREAVQFHQSHAAASDIILLSPGCASFGMFKNEFDRGEMFRKIAGRVS